MRHAAVKDADAHLLADEVCVAALVATRASLALASVHCSQADGAPQSERRARRREESEAERSGEGSKPAATCMW